MIYLIKIFFIIFFLSNNLIGKEIKNNQAIFKIKDKIFTNIDFENRIKYIEIINTTKIENIENFQKEKLMNDYISSLIFYEYGSRNNKLNTKINVDAEKIFETNILNNKINNNLSKKDISEIYNNIKIDLVRKEILEKLLNDKKNELLKKVNNLDLLYNYNLMYLIIDKSIIKNSEIKKINNRDNLLILKNELVKNKINFFFKEENINDMSSLPSNIQNLLRNNIKISYYEDSKYFKIYSLEKNLESYEGVYVKLLSFKTENEISKNNLNCDYLETFESKNYFKEYEYSKLNDKIKKSLKSINDYIIIKNNKSYDYIFLCDLRYDENLLKSLDFNKRVKKLAVNLEIKFVKKYKKEFNFISFK